MKTYVRTADGSPVDEFTAMTPNGILRDGFTIRTKMLLMDSQSGILNTPHIQPDNTAAREARAVRLESAWKHPAPSPVKPTIGQTSYETRVSNAWR